MRIHDGQFAILIQRTYTSKKKTIRWQMHADDRYHDHDGVLIFNF